MFSFFSTASQSWWTHISKKYYGRTYKFSNSKLNAENWEAGIMIWNYWSYEVNQDTYPTKDCLLAQVDDKESLSDFLKEWLDFYWLRILFQYCSGHRTVTVRENCNAIVADTLCSDSLILLVVNCPICDLTDVKKTNILASTLIILHYDDLMDTCIQTSWSIFAIGARRCCDMSSNFEGHFRAVKCEERYNKILIIFCEMTSAK